MGHDPLHSLTLSEGWHFKAQRPDATDDGFLSEADWLPATVPGTVHQDLMAAGRIPDPFLGLNELDVQWVGECDWLYRCRFDLPAELLSAAHIALCCDGLDTVATLWLNGELLLESDNMFVPHRLPVGPLLQPQGNELRIRFRSALREGQARERVHGVRAVWNGDPSRVYLRKAQYHYGWDWGPTLLTAGPWRPIRLEAYQARLSDLHCPIEVAPDLGSARLPVRVTVEGAAAGSLSLDLALHDPDGALVGQATLSVSGDSAAHTFEVATPRLWWPRGAGEQPLYRLEATLRAGDRPLDGRTLRLGIRQLRLVQEPFPDEPGTSFVFEINGTPIFCGGVNWIPADSFTPRITPEHERTLLALTADAHMNMIRIWGGGVYEEDRFYDTCDALGILVWQDFMFACGIYPAHPEFQASVQAEAEATVRRLRHHPSLVLWCGNNEDQLLAASLNRYHPELPPEADPDLPARLLYEHLLPAVCEALDGTRPYWPGSPSLGSDPNDPTVGDRHTWDVWHGVMAPYQAYPRFGGRFVSEFGMQAFPDLATIEGFAEPAERYPQSRTIEHHNKATDGPRRLAVYLNDTLRMPTDLPAMVYGSQLVQAEALGAAIRGWRRRFRGPGRAHVAGALIWQLNDCWPVTSWAIVDYACRPKAAYYVVRRELAPLVVGMERTEGGIALWAVNGGLAPVEALLELRGWTLEGEPTGQERRSVQLPPNQAIELGTATIALGANEVLGARLVQGDAVVARAVLWPEPFKYLTMPDPEIVVQRHGDTLRLSARRPAKGVWLSAGDGVRWSDNMLDLLPDDPQIITADGLDSREPTIRWLS